MKSVIDKANLTKIGYYTYLSITIIWKYLIILLIDNLFKNSLFNAFNASEYESETSLNNWAASISISLKLDVYLSISSLLSRIKYLNYLNMPKNLIIYKIYS